MIAYCWGVVLGHRVRRGGGDGAGGGNQWYSGCQRYRIDLIPDIDIVLRGHRERTAIRADRNIGKEVNSRNRIAARVFDYGADRRVRCIDNPDIGLSIIHKFIRSVTELVEHTPATVPVPLLIPILETPCAVVGMSS